MHWILQGNMFFEKGYQDLIDVLDRFSIPYSEHKVIPFVGELEPFPDLDTDNVICMGSYSMRHIAKKHKWNPGVIDLFDQNFLVQKEHWGDLMLNYDSEVLPFKDVKLTEDKFMRPIDDSKYFAGRVFSPEEFHDWQHKVCVLEEDFGDSLTGDTLVQVCSHKEIYAEYRFWIVDRKIATASLYKRGSRVTYASLIERDIEMFAAGIVTAMPPFRWVPADAFVLDLCKTPDGIKIVEINTINSAGFYAADMQKLVMALEGFYNEH